MGKLPIPYAGSIPYRKMCRYNSGFFYEHELLSTYDYYWRVEPNVKFCKSFLPSLSLPYFLALLPHSHYLMTDMRGKEREKNSL